MIKFEKTVSRLNWNFFRFYSINIDPVRSNPSPEILNLPEEDEKVLDQNWEQKEIRREGIKSLRIAILGLPNVGKSTLVNRLIGRPVCGMSSKVHTTRSKSEAIFVEDDTQLIFVDTPGLVTNRDFKKFKLSTSFKSDVDKSLPTADVVGVVQDAAHPFKSSKIDERIMECLQKMNPEKRSILILNKVDKLKKKKRLLELVKDLTSEDNWPKFSDVFMISALKDDGVDDLRNYLLDTAEKRDWEYDSNVVTNIEPEQMAADIVRSRFMDALPEELPYLLRINVEHFGVLPDESVSILVAVSCPTNRISNIVMGKHGARVKIVALQAEQELSQALRTTVRLKIAIKFTEKKEKSLNLKE